MKRLREKIPFTNITREPFVRWTLLHGKLGFATIISGVIILVVLMFLHKVYYLPSQEYLWAALLSIPVTILCLGGFSVMYEWYMRNTFASAMRSVISAWDTGVTVYATHERAPNRVEFLEPAKKIVKLMSTTFKQYFALTQDSVNKKMEAGVKFQIIIYEPNSNAVKEKEIEEGRKIGFYNDEIISTCKWYLSKLLKQYPDNIEIRFINYNAPFGITIIDDIQMVLSLNIYGLDRLKKETPCLTIENKFETESVFKQYDKAFNSIWNKLPKEYPESVKEYFN